MKYVAFSSFYEIVLGKWNEMENTDVWKATKTLTVLKLLTANRTSTSNY